MKGTQVKETLVPMGQMRAMKKQIADLTARVEVLENKRSTLGLKNGKTK